MSQESFTIESIVERRVLFIPEQRREFSVPETLFLSMILGEPLEEICAFRERMRRRTKTLLWCVVQFLCLIHRLRKKEVDGWVLV